MDRRNLRWRAVLLLLAVVVGIVAQAPAIVNVRVAEYDEAVHLDIARNIQRIGKPIRSLGESGRYDDHTPLYLYLLSLYGGDSSTASIFLSRLVTTFFGLGSILLTFLIGERIAGTLAGFGAAILLAINPFFASYSFFIRMEVPMVFMLLLGLFLLIDGERRTQPGIVILAGFALATAVLLREFALLLSTYCSLCLLFAHWRDRRFYFGILLGSPVVAVFLAWLGWLRYLSPLQFQHLLRRWTQSAATGGLSDPRMFVSLQQWGQQIAQDLLGIAVSAALVITIARTLCLPSTRARRERLLLLGYLVLALGTSLVVRLRELRHVIEVVPIAVLLISTGVDWDAVLEWGRSRWLRGSVVALGVVLFLFFASPMRLSLDNAAHLSAWFDPLYARRVFGNDPYYNVLRLAGLYIRDHSEPDEVITVVHEGPVVGYYADRHYNMLYTLPDEEKVAHTLEHTRYLIWDHTLFLSLSDDQVQAIQDHVAQNFAIEEIIQDDHRQVTIYLRSGTR